MELTFGFILRSLLLGAGLAMDAFSVSVSNALAEPNMKKGKIHGIAGTYAFFQFLMPLLGWFLVRTLLQLFSVLEKAIPYAALILLVWLGVKMILGGVKKARSEIVPEKLLTPAALLVQGLATSMDALSVGLTIEHYSLPLALLAAALIGLITYGICLAGLKLGKELGSRVRHAEILGGCVLIGIGIEIFVKNVFF